MEVFMLPEFEYHGTQVTVRSCLGHEDTACIMAESTERIRMKFRIGGLN